MRLRLNNFNGEIPKLHRTLLPEGFAQTSHNVDYGNMTLQPMRKNSTAHDASPAKPKDFYLHKGTKWLTFDSHVDVVPGPVAQDRLYISREGKDPILKVMPAGTEYPLALPTPAAPLTVSIEVDAPEPDVGDPPNQFATYSYTYTWVSIYDEETIPAPPSMGLDVEEGATVRLVFVDRPPVASRIDRIRVYRTQTSASGVTEYHFIKELNEAVQVYVHDVEVDPLAEILPSAFFDPPVTRLQGFTAMHAGMIAAFKGKSLYFCEPYRPHAWPVVYELTTDYDIVALVSFGPILGILTTGTPYIAQGTAPENMIMERIELNAPCIARDGVVDLGYAAAYPSTEGIILLSQNGGTIVTHKLFTRKQWLDLNPKTISAGHRMGSYIFTHSDGKGGRKTVTVDVNGENPSLTHCDTQATKISHDLYTGRLHFLDGGTKVYEYSDESAEHTDLEWVSSEIILPTLTGFGVIQIEGDKLGLGDPPFTATIYADGERFATAHLLNEPIRLPAGLARRWSVGIKGCVHVTGITIAGSMQELFQ